ncbi:hypothetical protein ILP92_06145 [Maribius pontilimi]|uniref:Cation/multidrug efflux pump n=1 Tax=Palleronia pontilimi TaxID=1964209 RepID=A0A934IGT9_9RHOB|nr:hypothetical protein [Palleronia pontilimi]MBJ3762320.1 hypothetical protein [Palleronia pontilimi]
MLFAIARLILGAAVILGVLYLLVSIYARSLRREALEKEWAREERAIARDAYVKRGMVEYDKSLKRRALLLIFIVPPVVVGVMAYMINT